jgi:pimeloyl-ACP methyl ester carboxylesterase
MIAPRVSGTGGCGSGVQGSVRLADGRRLGYAEYGAPAGRPVLYFPGTPSSRLMHPPEAPSLAQSARVIVVERPGYGLSDFQNNRSLLDWPADVGAFADLLGLDCFPVVGVSGGGPYAAVCAAMLPGRVSRAALISAVGSSDLPGAIEEMPRIRQLGTAVGRHAPGLLAAILWLVANPRRNPEKFFQKMISGNSAVDQAILSRPEIKAMLLANYQEAARSGVRGFAQDSIILSNPWGFRPQDIRIPVSVWHGEADANISISAARWLAGSIPGCQATFLPGEGHWLILEHWGEILSSI